MTSNTAPYGVASASSIIDYRYDAYLPFSKITGKQWNGKGGTNSNWLQYEFANLVTIKQVMIKAPNTTGNNVSISIYTSTDGTNFNLVGTMNSTSSNNNTSVYIDINKNNVNVKFLRLTVNGYNMKDSTTYYNAISMVQAYGR